MPIKTPPLKTPGDIINGRYSVTKVIGKGASGEVYVVNDEENDNKMIALKYLKVDPEYKPALEHFKSEFDTMTHLNHPNIAEVYDFEWDADSEYYFFTSELIDGFDFVTSVRGLDIEKIETLLIQSLRALEYLHGHGIFHFDIKPQNILVQGARGITPSVKVIDFGLASTKPPGRLVGTPSYIAPEMIEKKEPDGRADLYSLGVLAYLALTGASPFRGKNTQETLDNHLKLSPLKPSELSSSVPEYLSSIVMKLIEKDPNHRYFTPAEVIRDINFRSTRFYAIETPDTLISYIPWEGPFVGRKDEITTYKDWLDENEDAIEENPENANLLWVKGDIGTGKSRFIEECKNIAQLLNFQTIRAEEIDAKFLTRLEKQGPRSIIIIDEIDKKLSNAKHQDISRLHDLLEKSNILISSSNNSDSVSRVRNFIAGLNLLAKNSVELKDFNFKELRSYIRTITGLAEAPSWLTNSLYAFTGGNPLFLTETMKDLISKGMLFDSAGRWAKTTMEDLGVDLSQLDPPESTLAKLNELFKIFTEHENEVASLLSTLQKPCSLESLEEILNRDLKKDLDNLITKKIVRFDEENKCYSFGTTILNHAFYLHLTTDQKRYFHDKIINFMLARDKNNPSIRFHVQRASNPEDAKKALLEEINNNQKEKSQLTTINEYLSRFGYELNDEVFDVTLKKAETLAATRNITEAHRLYQDLLIKIPDENDASDWNFRLNQAIGMLYLKERKLDQATNFFKKAKKIAKNLDDSTASILVENNIAAIDLIMGNLEYAIAKYEKSRSKTKKVKKEDTLKIKNNDLGHALFYNGKYNDAIDVLKDDVKLFQKIEDNRLLCRALYSLGEAYRYLRKFDKAKDIFQQIIEKAKGLDDIPRLYRAYNGLGNVLNDEGNFSDSIGYFDRALDLAIHIADYDAAINYMINTAIIYSNVDEVKKAFDTFQTALTFLERSDFPVSRKELYLCRIHLELGELSRLKRKYEEAVMHLDKALELASKPQAQMYMFWILITQAKLAKDQTQPKEAKTIIKQAKKLADTSQKKKLLDEVKKYQAVC